MMTGGTVAAGWRATPNEWAPRSESYQLENLKKAFTKIWADCGKSAMDDLTNKNDEAKDVFLEPDRGQIAQFVHAIFPHASSGGFVAVRGMLEFKDKVFPCIPIQLTDRPDSLDFLIDGCWADARRAAQEPQRLNSADHLIAFCPPLATFPDKVHTSDNDIVEGLALSVVCGARPWGALEALIGPPTVVVQYSSADASASALFELHWRLATPARRDDRAKLKKAAALAHRRIGIRDPSNATFHWPGSWYRLTEPPQLCTIEAHTDAEIDLDDALEALTAKPTGNGKGDAGGRQTALAIAEDLVARGYKPIPVPVGKSPKLKNWQNIKMRDNLALYFSNSKLAVGAQMGPVSGGLTDVDLDCAEAMKLAPYFLPETGSVYGRASKPRSHYLYKISDPGPKASTKLNDENRSCIIELRLGGGGKGAQSVMPGSLHPSGEVYAWSEDDEPAQSDHATLNAAIVKIAVATLFARHWPEKSRNDASMRVGCFLARAGWQPNAIGDFVVAVQHVAGVTNTEHIENGRSAAVTVAESFLKDGKGYGLPAVGETFGEDVAKQIAKLLDYRAEPPPPSDGRPLISVVGGELYKITDEAEKMLMAAGMPFYVRSNKLVRPIVTTVDTFHGGKTTTVQLTPIDRVYMRDALGRKAQWQKYSDTKKSWVTIDPPYDVADTLLARAGDWNFPSIAGITTTQTLRPDGTILDKPGYDPSTRLLLIDPPPMPPIPDRPTKQNALDALKLLKELLFEFPFVSPVDLAVGLSIMITPVVRGALRTAPLHAVSAPDVSAGKSYLLNTTSNIVSGQDMPVISAGPDEKETEKRLGSALLAGQQQITIDNVNGELGGSALCSILTQTRPQVRILGKSEQPIIETGTTCIFANGNNIIISGDLWRRVIRAQLNPKMEDAHQRIFKGDPVKTVLADRGKYIAAALIICRAYIVAGRPDPAPPLASFEDWSDIVRSALIWLGEADPVASMAETKKEEPGRQVLGALLAAWQGSIGTGYDTRKPLREVIELATAKAYNDGTGPVKMIWPDLAAAVAATGQGGKPIEPESFGKWMRSNKDRIVGDLHFTNEPDPKGAATWWVVDAKDEKGKPGPEAAL